MKILLTMNLPYTRSHGGTNRSNRCLCEGLAARGHAVHVVAPALATPPNGSYEQFRAGLAADGVAVSEHAGVASFSLGGVEVHAVADPARLRTHFAAHIAAFDPDWVLVSAEDPSQSLLEAAIELRRARTIYLAHTPQMFPFGPASLYPGPARAELVSQAAGIVAISQFVAEYVKTWIGRDAFVNHPPHYGAGPFARLGRFDAGYALLMNACAVKGLPIVLELARALPDLPFAALPGYGTTSADRAALARLPNMTLLPNQPSLDAIFAQARVLLMPSLWTEGFGMAAVDAMLRGIPVLASSCGGLPEAKLGTDFVLPVRPIERFEDRLDENLLPAPVVPPQDVAPWRDALARLLADRALYERQSEAAYAAAGAFVAGLSVAPFERYLQSLGAPQPARSAGPAQPPAAAPSDDLADTIARLSPAQRALLLQRLQQRGAARGARPASGIPRAERTGALPLSFAQQRLWFLDQLEPNSPYYNVFTGVRMRGALDVPALERTLAAIVRRHEALRTTFPALAGRPSQAIAPADSPAARAIAALHLRDLRHLPPGEREAEARRLGYAEACRPFDLERGPLLRAALLRLDEHEHVLLLTMHHIVADAWSMGVFQRELALLYSAFAAGQPPALPELPIQYADFAIWQREQLAGAALERLLGFWARQLANPPRLNLATDRPRPAVQSYRGATHPFELPAELGRALRLLGQSERATPFMTLLAAFGALLGRYAGQHDVLIGTTNANRTRAEVEPLIGFFVNTLVLRADMSGNPSFRQLLGRVREMAVESLAHQDLPFERLVEQLRPDRDLSRTPLFQVMFDLQSQPGGPGPALPGLALSPFEVESTIAKFDLTLLMAEAGDQLFGAFEYNADMFDPATIARMAEHFQHLLAAAVATPDSPLAELGLLGAAERRRLLAEWNATAAPPADRCVHQLFEAQAARAPDAPAVLGAAPPLTFGELNARANRLAHHLIGLGVGPEVIVGVCMPQSLDLLVSLLAILKAGGAYVPLDPAYPAERVAFILADTRAPLLLTKQRLCQRMPKLAAQVVCVDALDLAAAPAGNPGRAVPLAGLAYAIYTSGSTGRPKGVLVPHGALANHARAVAGRYDLRPSDRTLLFTSPSFDVAAEEIFPTWISGAAVALPPPDLAASLSDLLRFAGEHALTVLNLPSSYWHLWVAEIARAAAGIPTALRLVVVGSEPASGARLAEWRRAAGTRVGLLNAYGATETTITSTVYAPADDAPADRSLPIGRPIANTRAYVLDQALNPVPIGVAGELYIGGAGVARGYLGHPAQTAARFVPDPFGAEPGARLYRSGDLARRRADGDIEFIGRADGQAKLRGFRVEPGEVEAVLKQHAGLRDAAVAVRAEAAGDRLVAYAVPEPGAAPHEGALATALRAFLAERLPEYMLPSAFVLLPALPRTPGGKIDRRALPAPEIARPEAAPAEPQTPAQATLAAIWRQVLGREHIGIHQNFFELGGDSILSIQVIARANQAGLRLAPRQIFQHQTIAALAAVAGAAPAIAAEQGLVAGPLPLTPIQRWFFEQPLASPQHYNQALLFEVREALDPALLQATLGHLSRHHDALRLRFAAEPGGWQATIAPADAEPALTTVELGGLPAAEQAAAISAAAAELQAGLNLEQGPLVRAALFGLGTHAPGRLLLAAHHLLVDGVSWRILIEDLLAAYAQLRQGAPVELPAKTSSFKQWAERLAAHAQSDELRRELDFWLSQPWAQATPLPADSPAGPGANRAAEARTLHVALDAAETAALLHAVPAAYNTQINDALLAALGLAFADWLGRSALLVEIEGHGREPLFDDIDLSRTVGWFTSMFPLVLDLRAAGGPAEALRATKEQLRRVPHNGIGYGLLRYLNEPAGAALRALPQAQVSFNYLGQIDQTPAGGAFGPAPEPPGPSQSPADPRSHLIDINALVAGGCLHAEWTYCPRIHSAETIERLAQDFAGALRAIIAHCRQPEAGGYTPSDFPLARLSQPQLDALIGTGPRARAAIDDIYPLAPMQQGMLFHSLYAPESGIYVEQLSCELRGALDTQAFEQAWRHVAAQHPILRTSFAWEGLDAPLQLVWRDPPLPVERHDWRGLAAAEQAARLERYLAADRRRGFALGAAPPMRLALLRTADERHVCVWTHHHLLLDGWSVPRVLAAVFAGYESFARGQAAAPANARPYRDYIAWLERQDRAGAEAFWRQALRGFGAPTPLPPGRPGQTEGRRELLTRFVPAETLAALRELARGQQLTLNTLVQGAWALLLSRYSRQADVLFGATVAGRPADLDGVEEIVGLFINTLPVRAHATPGAPLLGWLRDLQARQAELRQYEYTPLAQIQAWSELPHGTPLFESLVVFENYPPAQALGQHSGSLSIHDVRSFEVTNYPLTLVAAPGPELMLQLAYDSERFAAATIEQVLGHLQALLQAMVAHPGATLAELPMLTPAERRQLTARPAAAGFAPGACLHRRFEAQAARAPEATALVFEEQRVAYGELNARANRLAHHLRALGAGPGRLVGLYLERSVELVVGILGILKAGAAYVPIDPAYPAERVAFILADARAPLLLTQQHMRAALPALAAQAVCLDADWPAIEAASAENLPGEQPASDLAYVIYTSGSTGQPKGVLIEHGHVGRLFAATQPWFHFDQRDVWALFHSYAFDFSVWELWGALLYGGRLVVVPYLTSRAPEAFHALLAAERVTVLNQTPSAFRQLIAADERPEAARDLALRLVIFGGEALDPASLRPWFARHGDARPQLVNMYGITETTVHVTYRPIALADLGQAASVIGAPIPDLRLYLLDAQLQPVPLGVPGELFVGGAGVGRGYLGRPELTAERFVPDAFGAEPGARLYRSGDLARFLPNGDLEYLGRIDHQIKVRGFRVELGEIAAALARHPGLRESAVLARRDADGDARLVAYVVPRASAAANASELRAWLRQSLPEYMLPSAFVMLDALPLTPNGKLDRRALPAPDQARPELSEGFVAPSTATEHALASLWAEVLGVARVGVHDNFFDLGGDSMRSIQILAKAREHGLEISLQRLFALQTIHALAREIDAGAGTAPAPEEQPAQPFSMLSAGDRARLTPAGEPVAQAAHETPETLS